MSATGDEFSFIKASFDGGVMLECWRNYELGEAQLVMAAIWRDQPQEFVVKTEAAEVPFDLWETFVAEARRWCPDPNTKP